MTVTRKLMTAEELWRLPDDGQRHELVAGELRTMPFNGVEHGAVAVTCATLLGTYVYPRQLGRLLGAGTGFLLTQNPDTVRAPDLAFISRERIGNTRPVPGYYPGAPDLAVEVIDPNDFYMEVEDKVAAWLEHGTRMVIVVNPFRRTVAVHRSPTQVRFLTVDDRLDGEDVVPGWTLPVREIFAPED